MTDTTVTKGAVKFVDDSWLTKSTPVEPDLLSLLARQRLDDLLSTPTPSVLNALSTHSVSLYDLGVRAGMDWRRRADNDVTNHRNNTSYLEYERMMDKLRNTRAHTAACKHLAYIEGWIAGWGYMAADAAGTAKPNWLPQVSAHHAHTVNRGAY